MFCDARMFHPPKKKTIIAGDWWKFSFTLSANFVESPYLYECFVLQLLEIYAMPI